MGKSAIQYVAELPDEERNDWLSQFSNNQLSELKTNWRFHARPEQMQPQGDWNTWMIMAGRGFGKTRAGAETVREWVETEAFGPKARIALVGATVADVRDTMIEGESGLENIFPEDQKPDYQPSKRRIVFKNGYTAYCYSADAPDRLRGPQHHCFWADELAAWQYPDAYDQLSFGLRLGDQPKGIITTTPRPIPLVREIMKRRGSAITRGSTFDNAANLPQIFLDDMVDKYEGTRLGRQELYAELLDDVPGALWTLDAIDAERRRDHPTLVRVVVAIDPSVSHTKKSDECGIIVAGCGYEKLDHRMHGYVLDDLSAVLSTDAWAQRAVEAYYDWGADRIVAEVNNGGDLVESTIRTVDHRVSYKSVHASRGKYVRAEPVAALYEQKRIHHIGAYPALEDQMCLFTPSMEFLKTSPDRADAVVWAFTEMMLGKQRRVQRMDMNVDEGTRTSPWKGN